jgi:hypothetical protein
MQLHSFSRGVVGFATSGLGFGPAVIHLLSFKGEIEFWSFREYALNSLARAHCVQVTGYSEVISREELPTILSELERRSQFRFTSTSTCMRLMTTLEVQSSHFTTGSTFPHSRLPRLNVRVSAEKIGGVVLVLEGDYARKIGSEDCLSRPFADIALVIGINPFP